MAQGLEEFDIDSIEMHEYEWHEKFSYLILMKTWNLICNLSTPDFEEIRKFMIRRYRILDTDVPHDEVFSGLDTKC